MTFYTSESPVTSVAYAAIGFVLGRATDAIGKRVVRTRNPYLAALLRVTITALVLAVFSPAFHATWQATTPGLFFVTMFFGTQTTLIADITRTDG